MTSQKTAAEETSVQQTYRSSLLLNLISLISYCSLKINGLNKKKKPDIITLYVELNPQVKAPCTLK